MALKFRPEQAEHWLGLLMLDAGLSFERQYPYVEGRKFRADFAFIEQRLLVEVTGGIWNRQAHGSVSGVLADNARLNAATIAGWRLLRVRPDEVEDGTALDLIQRALTTSATPR